MFKSISVQVMRAVQFVQVSPNLNLFVLKGFMSLGSLKSHMLIPLNKLENFLSSKSHDTVSLGMLNPLNALSFNGYVADDLMSQVFLYREWLSRFSKLDGSRL